MGYMTSLWKAVGLMFVVSVCSAAVEWIERPQSVSAREGENVTFVCRLSAADPNIIWVKDEGETILFTKDDRFEADQRFSIINKYDLVISNVKKEDNGVYACRTKDAGIQAATLTVLLYPGQPKIIRDKPGPVYSEGEVVKFTCSSTGGNPNPRITWLKNGNISTAIPEVKEATVVAGETSSTITIRMDKSDHQANYSCLLYNDLNVNNKLMEYAVLSVRYSPSIAFQPYYPVYTVKLGTNVEIVCDVDANPQVNRVTWSKDGIRLSGSSTRRVLSPVSKADHGKYNCTARNSIGERSGILDISVQYTPIISVPSTITVNEGEDVSVKCDIDANPNPYEVQWSRVLPGGSMQTIVNNETLQIPSIKRSGAGNYSCKAQSQLRMSGQSVEFVSSDAFTYIYVQYKPGRASIGPVADIDVGERLDITCTATPAGYPEATYSWTKDGQAVPQNRQTLTISSVTLTDNGRYGCTPTNIRGSGQSAFVDVHVYEPPKITKEPEAELSIFLTEPNLLSLTCEATGYPKPTVSWYQEGQTQPLDMLTDLFTVVTTVSPIESYREKVQSILQFKGQAREESSSGEKTVLQIRDMGNYSCQAESTKHSDTPTSHTQLLINFPPVLEDTASRLAVSRLDEAQLTCAAQAHPDPAFQWFFKGQRLTPSRSGITIGQEPLGGRGRMRSILTVPSVLDQSYGLYTCVVLNALGNVTKVIKLSMKSPPEKPNEFKSPSQTWESIMLAWVPGFDGGYQQAFYLQMSGGGEDSRRIEVKPTSSRSYNVTKLRPSSTYTFQVIAGNELGYGPSSQSLTVTTKNLQIPSLPKMPVFDARQRKLVVVPPAPYGNDYCLRVEVRRERGDWSPINGCMKVMGDTLEIAHSGVIAINVSVCLSHRTDVCGIPVAAEIHSNEKEAVLTEEHVIIIACVCGVIIVTLLIILFCFIFRRRRNAAKNYQAESQGDPPPYNAVAANKKPQAYDNQGMDTSDLQLTPLPAGSHLSASHPTAPPASPSTVHANSNSYTNNSYGPLDLQPGYQFYPTRGPGHSRVKNTNSQHPPIRARPYSGAGIVLGVDRHITDNELNQWSEHNRMDNYPNRDNQGAGDVPRSPTKDKYIDLQDRGGGGDIMVGPDAGYNSNDPSAPGGKPKKKLKWRWHWKAKENHPPPKPQFSHNPPGHTCGLPCCNQDNEVQQNLPPAPQRGCVQVPIIAPAELSESNFFMKKKSHSTFFGRDITSLGLKRNRSDGALNDADEWESVSDDDDVELDDEGNRVIHFTEKPDVIGPVASAELIGLKGAEFVNDTPTLLRHRKQKLEPWEQIRQRCITLPDLPRTPHRMIFLNHQPGETSDYSSEAGTLEARSPWGKDTQSVGGGTLPTAKNIVKNTVTTSDTNDSNGGLDSGSNVSSKSPVAESSSSDSKAESSSKTDEDSRKGAGRKKRIVNSKLPPVPTETDDVSSSLDASKSDSPFKDELASLEEDTSLFDDHVYDVPSDVIARARKLGEDEASIDNLSVMNLAQISSASDLTVWDAGSLTYQASISDSNTGSYIYNGSLFSQNADATESSLYYPGMLLKHRFPVDKSDDPTTILRQRYGKTRQPMIFMLGGRPVILSAKTSDSETSTSEDPNPQQRLHPSSCIDPNYDLDPLNSSTGSDYVIEKSNIRVDEFDMGRIRKAETPEEQTTEITPDVEKSISCEFGFDLDCNTKLKLWDLRLITVNREQNHYSTFPLRKPTTDDMNVGNSPRDPDLGYRHRHNSDISSDKYVYHKIQRILNAPVLTKYLAYDTLELQRASLVDPYRLNPYRNAGCDFPPYDASGVESWRNFFPGKRTDDLDISSIDTDGELATTADQGSLPNWPKFPEEPTYDSISLWGIFNWGRQGNNTTSSHNDSSSGSFSNNTSKLDAQLGISSDRRHVDSLLVRKNSKHNQRRASTIFDFDSSSLYGGSVHSGYARSGELSSHSSDGSKRRISKETIFVSGRDSSDDSKQRSHKTFDNRPVIWGDASVVDWRRQAELFKDKNFVTLIL